MKTYLFFFFLILGRLLPAQQAEEFRIIKDYFDNQESLIKSGFAKKYKTLSTDSSKVEIRKQYTVFMSKLDSIRNVAYLGALIKVKNREDLHLITKTSQNFTQNKNIE